MYNWSIATIHNRALQTKRTKKNCTAPNPFSNFIPFRLGSVLFAIGAASAIIAMVFTAMNSVGRWFACYGCSSYHGDGRRCYGQASVGPRNPCDQRFPADGWSTVQASRLQANNTQFRALSVFFFFFFFFWFLFFNILRILLPKIFPSRLARGLSVSYIHQTQGKTAAKSKGPTDSKSLKQNVAPKT